MIYTGIGSRKCPQDILTIMGAYGALLGKQGFVLRSGAAPGADTAFEQGCDVVRGDKEIYLPWRNFSNHPSPLYDVNQRAYEVAADTYGPGWSRLKASTQKFLARDTQQVLGKNLDCPSLFVICWTADGCLRKEDRTYDTGGTGQAIAVASERNIPVFNLYHGTYDLNEYLAGVLV